MNFQLATLILAALWAFPAAGLHVRAEDQPESPAAKPDKPATAEPDEAARDDADPDKAPVKTREVKLKGLTLQVPEAWQQGQPSNNLRLGEFKIPPAKGDEKQQIELTVFSFGGGSDVRQNIERWISQFDAQGRKARITRGESPQGKYVFLDVSGTYHQPVGPPILQKTERLPEARMLAVIVAVEDEGVYYLKLAGPKKTVSASAAHLRKAFGGDAAQEKPLDLDGGSDDDASR